LALGQRQQKSAIFDPWKELDAVLRIRDPELFWSLDAGSVMGKKSKNRIRIRDLIFENLVSVFGLQILKFSYADPGSCQPWIRDPEWKKSDPGSWIRDKHPESATLRNTVQ
jgi:hypothetical protein